MSIGPYRTIFALTGMTVLLCGCQTPERRAVREEIEKMRTENSALRAETQKSSATVKIARTEQQQETLELIQALQTQNKELARKVETLDKRVAGGATVTQPATATEDPEAAKRQAELTAKLQAQMEETARQMAAMREQLAQAQVQAEAAKLAQQNENPKKPGDWVGRKLPLTKFVDASGELVDLATLRKKQIITLVFMKGYYSGGVCVYCTKQTVELAKTVGKFEKLGSQVFVVYPGPKEYIKTFVDSVKEYEKSDNPRFKLPFNVLLDADVNVSKTLGIAGDLAHPTSFVIDQDGVVQYQYVGRTIHDRPSAADLLGQIGKIKGTRP